MKRSVFLRSVSAVLAMILCLIAFAGCGIGGEIEDNGSCTIVLSVSGESAEYEVSLEALAGKEGAIAALDYLTETGKITYTAEDGGYGAYLTEVVTTDGTVSLKQDAMAGVYLYIYTSVEADIDVSSHATTVEYKGTTLTSAGVGISEMSLTDGAVIYITTITYQ